MSQRVVGYEGEGRTRRPIVVDEGPSSAAARDPIAMHANGGLPHLAVPTGGAGPVERRQISEAERAARLRDDPPDHLSAASLARPSVLVTNPTDAAMTAVSRQRGAEANRARIAALKPPRTQEESAMATTTTYGHPEALGRLAKAASDAAIALEAKRQAEAVWNAAQDALAAAWLEVKGTDEPASLDRQGAVTIAAAAPAKRRQAREPKTAGLSDRQSQVIDLMVAGKSRADVAREIGTTYQTVDGLLEAAAKKGLLPASLLPLLPARFAKFSGVQA